MWLEALKLSPQIGWVLVGLLAVVWFVGPVLRTLEHSNISKLGFGSVQIELVQKQIKQVAIAKNTEIPPALLERIERMPRSRLEVSVLWVDNNPSWNLAERRLMTSMGMTVDTARSTSEGLKMLTEANYNLVVSDLTRENEMETAPCHAGEAKGQPANAGCYFMHQIVSLLESKKIKRASPLIFFSASFDPKWGRPLYAFGATNKIEEFLHLVLDTLERRHDNKVKAR